MFIMRSSTNHKIIIIINNNDDDGDNDNNNNQNIISGAKNTVTALKGLIESFNSRLDQAEESLDLKTGCLKCSIHRSKSEKE